MFNVESSFIRQIAKFVHTVNPLPVICLTVLAICSAEIAQADTVTFKQGVLNPLTGTIYEGAKDTTIEAVSISWVGSNANQNFGGRDYLAVGRNVRFGIYGPKRPLILFDVDSLSGNYGRINSVTLRLYTSDVFLDNETRNTVSAYSLAPANTGWVEGNESESDLGESADVGMVTWNSKVEDVDNWAGSAGASSPGLDYGSTALATSDFDSDTPLNEMFDFVITGQSANALIEQWLSGNNSGIMLMADNDTHHSNSTLLNFWSSEASSVDYRPELIVDYAIVPAPSALILFFSAGVFLANRIKKGAVEGRVAGS